MTTFRVPTDSEFGAYDGAHCRSLWNSLSPEWKCPACGRSKREIMRWTRRFVDAHGQKCALYAGWMAGVHRHHDHSTGSSSRPFSPPRFPETVVCDQCNAADGAAKRFLCLPSDFSFSPAEIRKFVNASPHAKHSVDFEVARALYSTLVG